MRALVDTLTGCRVEWSSVWVFSSSFPTFCGSTDSFPAASSRHELRQRGAQTPGHPRGPCGPQVHQSRDLGGVCRLRRCRTPVHGKEDA